MKPQQKSYINDFTNLYNMPKASQNYQMATNAKSAADILKQRIHDQFGKYQNSGHQNGQIRQVAGQTINIQQLLEERANQEISSEYYNSGATTDNARANGTIDGVTTPDLNYSNTNIYGGPPLSPDGLLQNLDLKEHNSSIHNIPKQDTTDTRGGNLQEYLDESKNDENQHQITQYLLGNHDSKTSLMQSLQLINFPSSDQNSAVEAQKVRSSEMGEFNQFEQIMQNPHELQKIHNMSTISQNESALDSSSKFENQKKQFFAFQNESNGNFNLPLCSNAIPKSSILASNGNVTTAATSSCENRDDSNQSENKVKNKKLMDELTKLKSEINNLKQMQHDQSQMTINQSQYPTNMSQQIVSNRSKLSSKQIQDYEELLIENTQLKNQMQEKNREIEQLQWDNQEKDRFIENLKSEMSVLQAQVMESSQNQFQVSGLESQNYQRSDPNQQPQMAPEDMHVQSFGIQPSDSGIDSEQRLNLVESNGEIENLILNKKQSEPDIQRSFNCGKMDQNKAVRSEINSFLSGGASQSLDNRIHGHESSLSQFQNFVNKSSFNQSTEKQKKQQFKQPKAQMRPPLSNRIASRMQNPNLTPQNYLRKQELQKQARPNSFQRPRSDRQSSFSSKISHKRPGSVSSHHNGLSEEKIQSLFPDQLIKAQSFIDILGANNVSNNGARGSSPMIRLQNGANSLNKKGDDVNNAVQNFMNEMHDQGTNLYITRIEGFMYQIQVPNVKQYQRGEKTINMKIKLSLSGGQLMVKTGGGYKLFLQWLNEKRVL